MATAADWAAGYLAQARVDLAAASQAVDASVRAMLLQMTMEKIAKAALLKSQQWSPTNSQTTHRGASHMMRLLLWPRYLNKLAYERYVVEHVIKPMVDELESLHPANAPVGPWLEYPWLTPTDAVAVPCQDLPILAKYGSIQSNRAALLMRFAATLIDNHDRIFA
jgi:hypothetical protein